MLHQSLGVSEIHAVHNWLVADLAARLALVVIATDIGKFAYQSDTKKFHVLENNSPMTWGTLGLVTPVTQAVSIAASDEVTALTAGLAKVVFRMPFAMTLSAVRASLTTAQVGGLLLTINVKENGVGIFSTKPTLDNTEKTTVTAATPSVITDSLLSSDSEISIDIDQVGDGTAKGLKVYLIGVVA